MTRLAINDAGGPHVCAFLDMIRWSEIGEKMLADPRTDEGYKVLVGSTPGHLLLFNDYSHHPHVLNEKFNSTAAGAYQEIFPTWSPLQQRLALPDFSPASQDRAAIELLREHGALPLILAGGITQAVEIAAAIRLDAPVWASLPGAGATLPDGTPQHENRLLDLLRVYGAALFKYQNFDRFAGIQAAVSGTIP